ncbi:MAG: hypothetical protein GXY01_04895 [Clostridiales bacterium]|jgi:hypothetical protein|nr:hypothetical protein [Clostridiales bacterium]
MDLWTLEQIVVEASSISPESGEQCGHLSGKIDGTLDYNPYYSYVTISGQKNLSEKIIPESLNTALSAFHEANTAYLTAINDKSLIKSEELSSTLRSMNIDISTPDEVEMDKYINQLNGATELMKKTVSY